MITYILIAIIGLLSYQAFSDQNLKYKLSFHPYSVYHNNEYSRFITSIFVHGDWTHLLLNLFVLYGFGLSMENEFKIMSIEKYNTEVYGYLHYLAIFFLSGICGDLPDYFSKRNTQHYLSLGASGAISGLLFAFIMLHPTAKMILFIGIPIPMVAWLYGIVYVAFSIYAAQKNQDNINHLAHLGGATIGILYVLLIFPGNKLPI
ncbi:MAG: rhomboid family intramembrane serine protease [Saprospiraceae bacterium]|jgi:membrane associated rhomboid family serine protease|nr:rhomboid family intramembrane serine protease [Saprospiraceae bacterium]